jgi:integrase/recombinase XerC
VVSLDVAHVDLTASVVQVLGKGQTERVPLTLPDPTRAALVAWLAVRDTTPGPLFVNFDRARKGPGRRIERGAAGTATCPCWWSTTTIART